MANYSNIYDALPVIFSDNIHKNSLYHYTSMAGFLLMMQDIKDKKCYIFPGHMRYQNDMQEFYEGISSVEKYAKEMGNRDLEISIASKISNLNNNIFIACFCSNGDLLEQWKYYGSNCGLSIEFDFHQCEGFWDNDSIENTCNLKSYQFLERIDSPIETDPSENDPFGFETSKKNTAIKSNNMTSTRKGMSLTAIDVLYDDKEKREIFTNILDTKREEKMRVLSLYHTESQLENYIDCAISAFIPMCKNHYFKHEKESRLLFFPPEKSEIKYREKNGRILPYLKCTVVNKNEEQYPILSVTVGPGNNQNLVFNAVINMLDGTDSQKFISEQDCSEKLCCYNNKDELRINAQRGDLCYYKKSTSDNKKEEKVITYYSYSGILVSKSPIPFRD